MACRWVGDLATHPVTASILGLIALAAIFGLVFVIHVEALVLIWAVVIALILLLNKGARLMWERDRLPQVPSLGSDPVAHHVEHADNVTINYNIYGQEGLPPTPNDGEGA
jgi:hypothetical protein